MKKRLLILGITLAALGGLLALLVFPLDPVTITHAQTPTAAVVPGTLPTAGFGPGESGMDLWWLMLAASSAAMIAGAALIVAARRLKGRV